MKQQHAQAHEAGMQATDQNHERALAQQQQDADSMSQANDQAQQMGMAQIQRPQGGSNPGGASGAYASVGLNFRFAQVYRPESLKAGRL
jgi:hypothetical protein